MPRPLRLHVPGAFYHVTLRGNHRQNIFFSPADRQILDDITREVIERFQARLHAYCWMTNHIHLLIQVADAPLGRLLLRIAGRYARSVQKRLHTTGHLFEKRYHALLVDADAYLLELIRYVHLNPVRARMVQQPGDYRWSSHHAYVGRIDAPWITTDFALRLFHPERARAIDAYQRFMQHAATPPAHSLLREGNPKDHRFLAGDDFVAKILGANGTPRSKKRLEDIIGEACVQFGVTEEALRSRSSQRQLTHARAWVAHQAVSLQITSLAHVARLFHRSEATLRQSVLRHFNYP